MVVRACLFLFCLVPLAGFAAELRFVDVAREKGHIKVASETYIDAPPAAVFRILADYEGFQRISKVFEETRYLERDEQGNGVVYSRAAGCVLFFCKTIERVETLTITPSEEIVAVAIPEQSDVDFSVARWQFEPEGEGTRLLYGVDFKPDFWVPPLLGPMIIRAKLRSRGSEAAVRIERLANALQIHRVSP
ncbi:MAG: hypothetical protein HKO55_02425 [Gammaproteobacteria bacterium]|nr:hypothetical protein [Gammaproteobacteria bacterium]NNM20112.1 hypothetical protein [Gammaproteobacteria bacterium]